MTSPTARPTVALLSTVNARARPASAKQDGKVGNTGGHGGLVPPGAGLNNPSVIKLASAGKTSVGTKISSYA